MYFRDYNVLYPNNSLTKIQRRIQEFVFISPIRYQGKESD
jgi:hypothetical protein